LERAPSFAVISVFRKIKPATHATLGLISFVRRVLLPGLFGGSRILGLTFQQMMYNLSDKSNFRQIVFLRGFRTLNIGKMFFYFTTHVLEDVKQSFWLFFR
jgi:hypothetical protein